MPFAWKPCEKSANMGVFALKVLVIKEKSAKHPGLALFYCLETVTWPAGMLRATRQGTALDEDVPQDEQYCENPHRG